MYQVVKRDGKIADFDLSKIRVAITKAFEATHKEYNADIIDLLYHAWIPSPDPRQWPEYLRQDPVRGYGLYCFYQGIALGLQLEEACREV